MSKIKFRTIVLLILIPTFVFANAGSPMMWFGMLHSVFLNSFIGFFESKFISLFKIPNRVWLIVVGNYFSMIIGLYYIAPYFSSISGNLDFWGGATNYGSYELSGFIDGMVASFIATLVLEFPFFYLALKNKLDFKIGKWVYLGANIISNVLLFLAYYLIVVGGSK